MSHSSISLKVKAAEFKEEKADDQTLLKMASSPDEQVVLSALEKLGDKVKTLVDEDGNSFLHLLAQHGNLETIQLVLQRLGETTFLLCKKSNNHNKTPLLIANDRKPFPAEIINILLPYTLDYTIKCLNQKLSVHAILKNYPEAEKNSQLKNNLSIACRAINLAKNDVVRSDSHPETNFVSVEEKTVRLNAIIKLREVLKKTATFAESRKIIKKFAIANCEECAFLTMAHLLDIKKNKNIRLELMTLGRDDHAFVVIDRAVDSDIDKFETWGPNAVIVDAWSGEVFTAIEIHKKLMGYYSLVFHDKMEYSYNFLRAFNPEFHRLNSQVDICATPHLNSSNFCLDATVKESSSCGCFSIFSKCFSNKREIEKMKKIISRDEVIEMSEFKVRN